MSDLWGGQYPLAVGSISPTTVKVWFDGDTLQVYDTVSAAWHPVSATVSLAPNPPTTLGQLWLDARANCRMGSIEWRSPSILLQATA
jgi:hypothetical protein